MQSSRENCKGHERYNSGHHEQSVMLGVAAHRDLQGLTQVLGGTSQANDRRIDDETIDNAQEIRHAQHGPPDHKFINLSYESGLQTRKRATGKSQQESRTAPV